MKSWLSLIITGGIFLFSCKDYENSVNIQNISNGDTSVIYKDFDIFKLRGIKFSPEEKISFPLLTIIKTDTVITIKSWINKNKSNDIAFKKWKNGKWVAQKNSIDREYQGGRKTIDYIILQNDSTVFHMAKVHSGKDSEYADIVGCYKYTNHPKSIHCESYNIIRMKISNLRDLSIWDTTYYQNSTFHPWQSEEIFLSDNRIKTVTKEMSNKKEITEYTNTLEYSFGRGSFVYYLLSFW
ncbi:MAG TPA: hypothetical protein PKA77_01325 [Chitinophagaceae bacterium]|jgi:hypothetical protein|nr:hypothetical protein [Chitinophagaceae bacterium]HMU58274.1 hypothetical protein [Chitinophagaceae bacterium]